MVTANETAMRSMLAQRISKRQASHDVTGTNLQRSIGAEGYLHVLPGNWFSSDA
jgi:hypothetical protein